ncbi:MAG: hypothetical protein QF567_00510 [Candidatus Pacearchaeota archaeon]|nr:hypothetical protein [Candidatus Pacearchaeota archaeon]|tara:strand:+ start:321 stop:749 length:429 start_codon:yes stop_codon:yes gene_type:complete
MDKKIKKQIFFEILKGTLIILGIALFVVSMYQSEIQRYGIEIYLLAFGAAMIILTLISIISYLFIRKYLWAYIVSAVVAPIPFGIYVYFACSGDGQCLKWYPLACFFIFFITELFLIPISLTVKKIFKILKNQNKKTASSSS